MSDLSHFIESAVLLRREIHAHPEPRFAVANTVARIQKFLVEVAGINANQMSECGVNGLLVDIVGRGPVMTCDDSNNDLKTIKTIALRADTDALPMTEKNYQLPYRSKNEGVAHMCGHDGHIASLVSAACLINARASSLPSNCKVRLIFQPAEESPGGALPMMKAGCLEGIEEIYGMHNWPTSPVGSMRVKSGALMAHVCEFTIVVKGKGTHASQPHTGIDPILVTSALITAIHSIVSRSVHYKDSAVISVTQCHGGEANNVIPDTCTISGTIRDFDADVFKLVARRLQEVTENTVKAYGATADLSFQDFYPVLNNHQAQTEMVERIGKRVLTSLKEMNSLNELPENELVNDNALPMTGAEDFAYYLMTEEHGGKPGCFFFLGGYEEHLTKLAAAGVTNHTTFSSYQASPNQITTNNGSNKNGGGGGGGDGGNMGMDDISIPGAFATKEANELRRTNCICHGTDFDFNDNVIPNATMLFLNIVEDRLGIQLYHKETELSPSILNQAILNAEKSLQTSGSLIDYENTQEMSENNAKRRKK